jgi:hypothetical protein
MTADLESSSKLARVLVGAALLTTGCVVARDAPRVAVTTPWAAPAESGRKPPLLPAALESCTRPGAHLRDDKRAPRTPTSPQERQIVEAEAFVRDHPSPTDVEGKVEWARYKYARARAFFEANHWAESAIAFREIAMNASDVDVAIDASRLYLESINVLGADTEPARPTCYDEMARDVPVFMELYCAPGKVEGHGDFCLKLRHIRRDFERPADTLLDSANRGEEDPKKLYERAALLELARARRCVDEAHRFGARPVSEHCDEIAYYAGKAFLAGGQPEGAREAATVLLDPQNGMQSSPYTAKLTRIVHPPAATR